MIVFGAGVALSPNVPGAIFSPSGKGALVVGMITMILFPSIGLVGIIFSSIFLWKKMYNIFIFLLLATSLCMSTFIVPDYFMKKVAGLHNYQWTDQAERERQIQAQKQIDEVNNEMALYNAQLPAQKEYLNKREELFMKLYQKIKSNIEGPHKIITVNTFSQRLTIDNGEIYVLNNDPIIRKTADIDTISTYNEIMNGNYKDHTYIFSVDDYKTFKNYYEGVYYGLDNDELEKIINNPSTRIFTIPIPKVSN
jgi:hypothetical protein